MPEVKLGEAFKKAIELEERGYAFYKKCSENTGEGEGKSMFDFLASEEVIHANRIREMMEKSGLDMVLMVWIPDIHEIEDDIFRVNVPGGRADDKADSLAALNIGIQAEKNSIELYRRLGEQCGDESCSVIFNNIAGEEEKHLMILEKEVEFITETGEFHDFRTITS
ncbi:MAG: ferritin family protein [Candidatus Altiarchaeota archaeon]